jgi:T-complex protein 1 subunit beta
MLMANAVDVEARMTPGKKQLAMESFARALRQLPTIIADNAGYDSAELVSKIRAAHASGDIRSGIDVRSGTVGNMVELGITEAAKLKRQVLLSAAEAAEMILRVDDIIKCAPRKRDDREWIFVSPIVFRSYSLRLLLRFADGHDH